MNKHKADNDQEVKIKAYENGVYLSYVSVLKYLGQLIIILVTGFGVFLTLKFNYVDEKISNNKSEIQRLDREKMDKKDYNRSQHTNSSEIIRDVITGRDFKYDFKNKS